MISNKKGIEFASIKTKHPFILLDFNFFTIFVGHLKRKYLNNEKTVEVRFTSNLNNANF